MDPPDSICPLYYWNGVFQTARTRLRCLEAYPHPTFESRAAAEVLRLEWAELTIRNEPHPERLHPNRFARYNSRVLLALLRHAPVVIQRHTD